MATKPATGIVAIFEFDLAWGPMGRVFRSTLRPKDMIPINALIVLLSLLGFPCSLAATGASDTEVTVFRESWSLPLGPGFSGIATHGEALFTSLREEDSRTRVVCVERENGEVRWGRSFADPRRKGQENYGGGTGPHATPLIHRGRVFVLGFGGTLVALDEMSGEVAWSVDLVEDYGVEPVQFGFAATPVAYGELVIVVAGGEAGVLAFDAETGDVAWDAGPLDAAYVTPVLVDLEGTPHLVCVGENRTWGFDPQNGEVLWSLPHFVQEQTNYAMAVALDGQGVLVSGQGSRGIRRIDVTSGASGWSARVNWHARAVQFSHGRVVERDGVVYGTNGSLLCAVDTSDGDVLFKERGFFESNVIPFGEWNLRIDEEGELTLLKLQPERIEVYARHDLLESKAWAPPLISGDVVYARDAERLVAVQIVPPAAQEKPIQSVDTGYSPDEVKVNPAWLAFAHGRYASSDGLEIELVAANDVLSARRSGDDSPLVLIPRSQNIFAAPGLGALELLSGEGPEPRALEWTREGRQDELRRLPRTLVAPTAASRTTLAGTWQIPGAFELEFAVSDDGELQATGSAYPNVSFRVEQESPTRLWLMAVRAGYGIPRILVEVRGEGLVVHQGSETYPAVR